MTIPVLNLLAMGATEALPFESLALSRQTNVLETCGFWDVEHEDFALHSDYRDGLQFVGLPEPKYRRAYTLRWPRCTQGTLTFIRRHHAAYLAGGALPFNFAPPGELVVLCQYRGPPQIPAGGRQGGSATVVLQEVFITD